MIPQNENLNTEIVLKDTHSEFQTPVKVVHMLSGSTLAILPAGYNQDGCEDGHGCPVFLEAYEGQLRLIYWPDINTEEKVIVTLQNTKMFKL